MRYNKGVSFLAALALSFLVLMPQVVSASTPQAVGAADSASNAAEPIQIKVTPATLPSGEIELTAMVTNSVGKAVGNQPVQFLLETQFLTENPRTMALGTRVTDAAGSATFRYTPTWIGDHSFQARVAASPKYKSAETSVGFSATTAATTFQPKHAELVLTRKWLSGGASGLVLLVWSIILVVMIRIAIGFAGRKETAPALHPALELQEGGRAD